MVVEAAPAVRIGPQGQPERTLGWQILKWTSDYLLQPDGEHAGEPWKFTREQARFILWWYAIDEQGRFVYRRGMFRRMKGHGKDPMAAALCAIEFVGPCRYFGDDLEGNPIGVPVYASWVQTAAVSRDQTRNTMTLFPGMLSPRLQEEHGIDIGKEIIYAHKGRCRIEAVTSSPRALEGNRSTFVLKNETHHWLQNNEGHSMSAVIARNAAKLDARVLAISNAHRPGEDSDAERDWEAWQAIESGRSRATGFLYDSIEAPPDTDLADDDSLRRGLEAARGDSWWVPVDRLMDEIRDPKTPPSDSRRFYLNQIIAAEDAWVAPHEWTRLHRADYAPAEGAIIVLAFDGSKTDDHSALLGCEIETGHIFTLGIWDPARTGGEIDRELVDMAVERAFALYDVVGFYSDLHPFESYVDKWAEEHGKGLCVKSSARHPIAWDMRARQKDATFAVEKLYAAIVEGDLTHDGHPELQQHIANARRWPNQYGITIRKEHRESARKIDAAVTAALVWQCRQDYIALPDNRKRRKRGGGAMFAG